MPRRPVDEQALKVRPINIDVDTWYYEDTNGIDLYHSHDFNASNPIHIHIPYRLLAETISRAWGVELRPKRKRR